MPDLVLDHIGILVRDLDKAIALFESQFGYRQATRPVLNTRQKVVVVFLEKEGSLPLKLFKAAEASSPAAGSSRPGAVLHHLAFRTGDLQAALDELSAAGARVLAPPQPGEAFDGEPIAFVYAGPGVNVEIVATDKRRDRM